MVEIKEQVLDLQKRVNDAIKKLELENKEGELSVLEEQTKNEDFWNDKKLASQISQKINTLKQIIEPWRKIENDIKNIIDLINLGEDEFKEEIKEKITLINAELSVHEKETYFSGKYDVGNAVVSIFSGAGGVDAQDWSEMLLSMYLKFAERKKFETKILSLSPGTEAGIKSVSFEVKGPYAYGLLKGEGGVHRLVRLSPFDADKARHTSFSLVEVMPEIEDTEIKLNDTDLIIETFRASGHGGQSVNTTDSAVRIVHLPTQTTVVCQNERSQLQNKETALKILKSRIAALMEAERNKEIKLIKGDNISAEWGNQIRSYVLHPYQMVKDHRTGYETSNTEKVLAGEIDEFIDSLLKSSP